MDCIATVLAEAIAFVKLSFGKHACSLGLAVSRVLPCTIKKLLTFARAIGFILLQIQACFAVFDDQKLEA